MAKDVDLVIRAKNEASKALDAINTALGALVTNQEAVSASGKKTDSALSGLKTVASSLNREMKNLAEAGKIAQAFDKATASVDKLDTSVKKQTDDLGKLTKEMNDAAQAQQRLAALTSTSVASIAAQKTAVDETTKKLKEETAEVAKLEKALASLQNKAESSSKARSSVASLSTDKMKNANIRNELPGGTAQQSASILLAGELEKAKAQQAATRAKLTMQTTGLESNQAALSAFSAQTKTTTSLQTTLANQVETTTNALNREKSALDRAQAGLTDISAAADKAGAAMGGLAIRSETVTSAAAKVAASQAQAQARVNTLAAAKPVDPVTTSAPLAARAKVAAKGEYEAAQVEVQRLAKAMRDAAQPSTELAAAFGEAIAKSRLAKQAYLDQAEALTKLRGASFLAFSQAQTTKAAPAISATAGAASNAALPPIRALADETKKAGAALGGEGVQGATSFRDALKGIYGDTRESLSLMQRLRGEVLSLTAGFIGFQAAVNGAGKVLDAFKAVEATQSRLGAVFGGDTQRVGQEIEFLKREADRLGVSFTVLANEYGRLSIATKDAGISSQDTRKIFLSVAEAGRVNRLTNEQISKTFLALTQMMSKGSIQAEELKGQLGDALPGASGIFAAALGITSKELENLMQKGELLASKDNFIKFAAELDKRFGSQLQASLASTTIEMGRFQNSLEQAALVVAEGGFIEGFTRLLKTLNEYFKSDEGRQFFMSLGQSAGTFFNALAAIVPYLGQIKTAIGLIIAYKFAQFLVAGGAAVGRLYTEMRATAAATTTAAASQGVFGAAVAATTAQLRGAQIGLAMMSETAGVMGARFTVAATAVGVLRGAVALLAATGRVLSAAFGGVAGIILTIGTIAAGSWMTSVDKTTEALAEHKAIIDAVVTKYEDVKNRTDDWAKSIKNASSIQIAAKIQEAQTNLNATKETISAPRDFFGADKMRTTTKLADTINLFKAGQISAEEFKNSLNEIGEADPKLNKNIILGLLDTADKAITAEESLAKLKAVLALMNGTATDGQKKLLGLSEALKDNGAVKATGDIKAFTDAIDALKSKIPALSIELKKLKDSSDNLDSLQKALNNTNGDPAKITEALATYNRANKAVLDDETKSLVGRYGGEKIPQSLVKEIYGSEGYRSQAYQNKNDVPTIGYGSTNVNGKPVQMGDTITKDEAVKQMVEDLSKFAAMVDAAIGGVKISENQRNALISYVYNTGNTNLNSKTRAIFDSIREGNDDEKTAALIANGINTSQGVLNPGLVARRAKEARLYLTPDDRSQGDATGPTEYEKSLQKQQNQIKADKSIDDATAKSNQAAADQKKINDATNQSAAKREVAIEAALREKIAAAEADGVKYSAERLENYRKSIAAAYDQEHINDQAKEAEEKVNALYKLRQQILEQLKVAKEQGSATDYTAAEQALAKVNEQTRAAIDLAVKYWQAVGGPEADAAIAKLKTMGLTTEKNKTAILTAGKANEMLADGATRAFDTAAQGVGKAIAGTGKWADAIKGVGVAFLDFAADFLRQIANMILKQLVLNALQSSMGGGGGGGVGGIISAAVNALAGSAHTGGIVGTNFVGSGNSIRSVNPAIFANAARFHEGGFPGLSPNEVPAILKRNEEVLTENDPRNALNGGKGAPAPAAGPMNIQSVLVMDPNLIPEAMAAPAGTRTIVAAIRANKQTIKQLLE